MGAFGPLFEIFMRMVADGFLHCLSVDMTTLCLQSRGFCWRVFGGLLLGDRQSLDPLSAVALVLHAPHSPPGSFGGPVEMSACELEAEHTRRLSLTYALSVGTVVG